MRGIGDRWLAGETVEGVAFGHHGRVQIVGGALDGQQGWVALLMSLGGDPVYLVSLAGGGHVRLPQSRLRPAETHDGGAG
jgi:hypothetical protein